MFIFANFNVCYSLLLFIILKYYITVIIHNNFPSCNQSTVSIISQ